ncbi:PREDICTED: uncharacterized protein LOC101313362 [Fragaria vesca subsp. vesca]
MMHDVTNHDCYFVQKPDASGRFGLSTEQKLTCAMRMLAYGLPADLCDEFLNIAESTALEILSHFTRAIWKVYHKQYLRRPSKADLRWLLNVVDKRGFLGMAPSMISMSLYSLYYSTKSIKESFRKDVERAFGILQARFAIVRGLARGWDMEDIQYIMMTCIILHNMIVDDEHDETEDNHEVDPDEVPTRPRRTEIYDHYEVDHLVERDPPTVGEFMRRYQHVRCPIVHRSFQKDLVNHLWNVKYQAEQNRM